MKTEPVLYMMIKENSDRIKAKRAKDKEDIENGKTPKVVIETSINEDHLNHNECGNDWYRRNADSSDEEKFEWLNETLFDDQLSVDSAQETPQRRQHLQMI